MFIILEKFKDAAAVGERGGGKADEGRGAAVPRIAVALREAGPSITLTTATDVVAFALGSQIEVPCISAFCQARAVAKPRVFRARSAHSRRHTATTGRAVAAASARKQPVGHVAAWQGAAACIFFVFALQSTFFASLLVLDQRRAELGSLHHARVCRMPVPAPGKTVQAW